MKKFIDEFKYRPQTPEIVETSDYNAFPNKELLDKLRNEIIQNLIDNNVKNGETMDDFVKKQTSEIIDRYDLSNAERSYIYNLIDNEINGFGPLTELLKDHEITEIMVNSPSEIYIELNGKLIKDETVSFINNDHIIRVIQRLIQPLGRTIDTAHPMVDARLQDGSRLNAVLPPLSLKGPVLTIRKFKPELATIDDFLRTGTLTPYMARFLEACVHAKLNILIVGGTGAGKTTLLNVLSSFCDPADRIITIEDAAELRLKQSHVISLETRSDNYEGSGAVTIRDLVINSLRMRPDRIIVGEVRGKEAFDMLQAMNTGHEGSMTTMHANSPEDALNRLETMVLMNGVEIPVTAIREYIESAIQIVVQVTRFSDGRRRVSAINEITGIKNGEIEQKEIFKFKQTGVMPNGEVIGEFLMHKYIPKVYSRIKVRDIDDLTDIFGK
ncbi:MAG TPA: CpaF family protein [Candidatus Coprosoma intestinipullorum]|uniref:CpaF family protein n=1 Tax=Candidatus Coprosoma intestinipullorum TaxID=2840752 RepID=A0A9D0ZPD5_9FIRM|nr:CpaF family protein [Candidatus Coprosoma intestinipullorum]